MALPKIKQELTDAVLAAPVAEGGSWLTTAREAARARLADMGMPVRQDEYWKFTNPEPWTGALGFDTAAGPSDVFDGAKQLTLVFTDGVFAADASAPMALENVTIELMAVIAHTDLLWA